MLWLPIFSGSNIVHKAHVTHTGPKHFGQIDYAPNIKRVVLVFLVFFYNSNERHVLQVALVNLKQAKKLYWACVKMSRQIVGEMTVQTAR